MAKKQEKKIYKVTERVRMEGYRYRNRQTKTEFVITPNTYELEDLSEEDVRLLKIAKVIE